MELDPVFLSRVQFAFVISFHIIFPSFTIGLAAWLATVEGVRLATGNPVYRRVFDFWLKVFALSFGMGVVSGIVMAFQFGTNWSVLAERTGSIQGPLLGYEAFTAFMLEATFFGVVLLGRDRVPPWFYFLSCCMVSLGTMASSFWILANNSWMQVPLGHAVVDGKFVPDDWWAVTTGPIMRVRWPHMLLAAFLTTGMSVVATGAWYLLRGVHLPEARLTLHWGLGLVAVLVPVPGPKPWKLSFSYGRALQDPALEAWDGRDENLAAGQRALYRRASFNGAATVGKYTDEMEAASLSADDPPHRRDWRDD
jgi:cytochrome bd ubiquinol oxidase subunit I